VLHHEASGGVDRDRRRDCGVSAPTTHGEASDPDPAEIGGDGGEVVAFEAAALAADADGAATGVVEGGHRSSLSLLGQQGRVSL
jgi:hypothetical protein